MAGLRCLDCDVAWPAELREYLRAPVDPGILMTTSCSVTERRRNWPWEEREVEAARRAARAIGGRSGDEDIDPVQRPLQEAGEGEAEGFELAEADLIRAATHDDSWADPLGQAFTPEADLIAGSPYAEADRESSAETPEDDR